MHNFEPVRWSLHFIITHITFIKENHIMKTDSVEHPPNCVFQKDLNLGLSDLTNQSFIYWSSPEHTNKILEKESRNIFGLPKNLFSLLSNSEVIRVKVINSLSLSKRQKRETGMNKWISAQLKGQVRKHCSCFLVTWKWEQRRGRKL